MKPFRPMLAVDHEEARLRFPYYATPKLDGIRAMVLDGEGRSRSMKRFPNEHVHGWFKRYGEALANMDGELIVGEPTAKDVYARTTSGIMAGSGLPAFTFYVFDIVDQRGDRPFTDRALTAQERLKAVEAREVKWLPTTFVTGMEALRRYEEAVLGLGFEGVMLRSPAGRYKQGRATVAESTLLKVKRFSDAEAVILGSEEQMHNANPGFRNEIGRTQRSSAAAGKVGKGVLGALLVEGAAGGAFAGVKFSVGSGLNDEQRAAWWARRDELKGRTIRYRYFDIGVKDAPRFPVFSGWREGGV